MPRRCCLSTGWNAKSSVPKPVWSDRTRKDVAIVLDGLKSAASETEFRSETDQMRNIGTVDG
jgi:hypothetical protein